MFQHTVLAAVFLTVGFLATGLVAAFLASPAGRLAAGLAYIITNIKIIHDS